VAIYRPARPRWPAVVAAAVAGCVLGAAASLTWSATRPPDVRAVVASSRDALLDARGTLEVVQVEYGEAIRAGRVESRAEYDGALGALARSRAAFARARPILAALAPATAQRIDRAYDELRASMRALEAPESVARRVDELIVLLER
jgi:hypothetical protein